MMALKVENQKRTLYMVENKTLLMWLIAIDISRVKPEVKESLEAYREEITEALDAYLYKGKAINPRAS